MRGRTTVLITKEVDVVWGARNKKHYLELGYNYTKFGVSMRIPAEHTMPNSIIKVEVSCDQCDKHINIEYRDYIKNTKENSGKYLCRTCNIRSERRKKIAYEKICKVFEEKQNYFIASTLEEYVDNRHKVKYYCGKHPEYIQTTLPSQIKAGKGACWYCYIELLKSRVGPKNYSWAGGVSAIADVIRRRLWLSGIYYKQDKNTRCAISGKWGEVVHHIYPFNRMLKEAFKETGIQAKNTLAEYTNDEIESLVNTMIKLHSRYHPATVFLTKDIHKMFHKEYGVKRFTPEDYYKFKSDYLAGMYDVKEAA